jgi:hypothetical protein
MSKASGAISKYGVDCVSAHVLVYLDGVGAHVHVYVCACDACLDRNRLRI